MNTTELSPLNCAECGSLFTEEIILAGGSQAYVIEVRGHNVPIPGLYRCTGCHEAIKAGTKATRVTWEAAREYLDENYGPAMCTGFLMGADGAFKFAEEAAEVSVLLEALITLRDAGESFDFIPECDGHAHPAAVAHLN